MPSLAQVGVFAAVAVTGLAAPAPIQERAGGGQSFSLPRVAVSLPRTPFTGAEIKAKALRKYGVAVPESLAAVAESNRVQAYANYISVQEKKHHKHSSTTTAAAATTSSAGAAATSSFSNTTFTTSATGSAPAPTGNGSSGSVAAVPESGASEYVVSVNVGGTTMNLDFDTGSSDLWVFSTLQPSDQVGSHPTYDPTKSGTKLSDDTWSISYGDGSGAGGSVYSDSVVIGDLTVSSQAVEAATSVSSQFQSDTSSDGLVGFAFSSINTVQPQPQKTWFDNIRPSLAQPLFAAAFDETSGSYDIGALNQANYQGEITYLDVDNSQGFWQVGGTTGPILDTGTTLALIADQSAVDQYYAKIQGATVDNTQGGYVFPCSATVPDFEFQLGSLNTKVEAQYINFGEVGSGSCFGGVQYAEGNTFSILGDVYQRGKYIVYKYDDTTPQIGVAFQPGHGSSSSSS